MKKWLPILLFPFAAMASEGDLIFDVAPAEEEILENLSLDALLSLKEEGFDEQELIFFDLEESGQSLKLLVEGIFPSELDDSQVDLNDAFSFEKPLCSDFKPSPETIPEPESCALNLIGIQRLF